MGVPAIAMAFVAAFSAVKQNEAAKKSARAQKKARNEQNAVNAQRAAEERRRQIREERIKRAKMLQASENTGVEGSSGVLGGVGGLSTNLSANLGSNAAMLQSAQNISIFEQQAADANQRYQMWGSIGNFSSNASTLFTQYNAAKK